MIVQHENPGPNLFLDIKRRQSLLKMERRDDRLSAEKLSPGTRQTDRKTERTQMQVQR